MGSGAGLFAERGVPLNVRVPTPTNVLHQWLPSKKHQRHRSCFRATHERGSALQRVICKPTLREVPPSPPAVQGWTLEGAKSHCVQPLGGIPLP